MTCDCSPGATAKQLRDGLSFNSDGTLEKWCLRDSNLTRLPKEFGTVCTTGDLWLSCNELTSLPEDFGRIKVGGELRLGRNQLTTLPASFGSITVGEDLVLEENQLCSLPTGFEQVTVGGNLVLRNWGEGIGPVMTKACELRYSNVKGEVYT